MIKVTVRLGAPWTVELPAGYEQEKAVCDDPAIEAAMCGITPREVYLRGEDKEPAKVHYEVHEEDCEIEDEGRE